MQRFKATLTTGNYPGNPEALIRDKEGDFVLHKDVQNLIQELDDCLMRLADYTLMQHDNGDYYNNSDTHLDEIAAEINRIL